MRLKSLEIVGFKSFADRVTIDLTGKVTCFVGPNGCGKSNIVDAFKWVLGEQRVSALRGDRMHDVIFNGNASGRRQPMNFAEVSLTITNDCGTLPIEFDEVVVTRRLYRSGESEYLLNRTSVRLKDIRKIFMNTGVGLDAYSIMEQGKIDGILEANPKARRAIFEEAAGISLYRAQRREADRKLERTLANLLRLGDIIDELERRIRSLKNQAGRARSYLQLTERIRDLRQKYYCHLYTHLHDRMAELETAVGAASAEEVEERRRFAEFQKDRDALAGSLSAVKETLFEKRSRLAELKASLEECDGKIDMLEKRSAEIGSEQVETSKRDEELAAKYGSRERELTGILDSMAALSDGERALAEEEARNRDSRDAVSGKLEQCLKEIEELENSIVDLSRKEVESTNKMVEAGARLKGLHAARWRLIGKQHDAVREMYDCRVERADLRSDLDVKERSLAGLVSDFESGRLKVGAMEQGLGRLHDEIRSLESDLVKGESRIDLLESLLERREGIATGAKAVAEEAAAEDGRFGFVEGILGEVLDVDMRYSRALEAVLGDLAEAVIVPERPQALEVLDFLREKGLGGVKVLVLSEVASRARTPVAQGTLASRVRCREELRTLKDILLSGVRLVENDELGADDFAGDASWSLQPRVNLRGDYYAGGVLCVEGGAREPGVISRRSELTSLRVEMEKVRDDLDRLQMRRASVQDALTTAADSNAELAGKIDEQEFDIAACRAEHDKLHDRINRSFLEFRVLIEEGFDIERSIVSLNGEMKDLDGEKQGIQSGVRERSRQLDTANMRAEGQRNEAAKIEERLKELEIKLVEFRGKRESLETEKSLVESSLNEARKRRGELQSDRDRLEALFVEVSGEIERLKARTEEMASERSGLSSEVEEVSAHLGGLQREYDGGNNEAAAAESRLEKIRQRLDGLRIEMKEVEVKQQGLKERAWEDVEVDLDLVLAGDSAPVFARVDVIEPAAAVLAVVPAAMPPSDSAALAPSESEEFDLEAVDKEIQELRQRLARMGNVNLEAVNELQAVEDRYDLLAKQREDLLQAQKSLKDMIAELNSVSRAKFSETFEDVKSHFNGIFRKLFHGGRAEIRLAEGEDVLEAGIEIIAGPPRKDVRSISLLSGGERSLTAVALLFALFKARPSPFCLLDEVDAALDETNVERFCSLLGDFIEDSHFMMVTHSKRTMANANVIYGVTMEEGGVSKVISVKLEEFQGQVA